MAVGKCWKMGKGKWKDSLMMYINCIDCLDVYLYIYRYIYIHHILYSYIHLILFVSPLMVGDLVRRCFKFGKFSSKAVWLLVGEIRPRCFRLENGKGCSGWVAIFSRTMPLQWQEKRLNVACTAVVLCCIKAEGIFLGSLFHFLAGSTSQDSSS